MGRVNETDQSITSDNKIEKKELIQIVMSDDGDEKLYKIWQSREIDMILPGLFPDRPGREASNLQEYLKGFKNIPKDRNKRLALLFLCLNEKKSLEAIQSLEIDQGSKEQVSDAVRLREDFHFIDSIYKVKRFMHNHGEELFKFMQSIAMLQVQLHDHPEIRNEARAEYYSMIKKSIDAVYMDDMKIKEDKLREIGIPEAKIPGTMEALLDFVHKYPECNSEDILIQKAKNVTSDPLKKLVKKFLGKY